jgi:hypothetical protein
VGIDGNDSSSALPQNSLHQAKLDLEKWQIEEDLKLRRDELDIKRSESSKRIWSSPLLIAVIGLFTTILASTIQNSCQSAANRDLERQRFEATRDLERQKFEAMLIQKALELSSRKDAADRFQSYLDLGLIKDESIRAQIEKYVKKPETIPLQPQNVAAGDENFQGIARKNAKLSIGSGPVETFSDLKDLISSLPSDNAMINRTPPLTDSPDSGRVNEEQRNVRVRCVLYAASRQRSNDFHLIVGRAPGAQPEMYMLVTVSGLPESNDSTFPQLSAARDSFKTFFGMDTPRFTYGMYEPGIPLEVEGSLFFNVSFAKRTRPGPGGLKAKMPTLWEIRPITKIVFEPKG